MTTISEKQLWMPFALLCFSGLAHADVILEPPTESAEPTALATINGKIGLEGYGITSGSATFTMPGYSTSASIGNNGQFTLQAGTGARYNLNAYVRISGYSANFSAYQYNTPQLAPGAIQTVDFTSPAGLIRGEIAVAGGWLTNVNLWGTTTDAVRGVTFYTDGSAALTQQPTVNAVTLPVAAGGSVSTSGSVTAINDKGCTVTRSLSTQTVTVTVATTTKVAWTLDISDVTCARGDLQGAVTLTGLPAGTVTGGSVSAYGAESRYQSVGSVRSYNFADLLPGTYTVQAMNYLAAPYQNYTYPPAYNVVVSGGQTTVRDFLASVAPAQGPIHLSGPWDLSNVNSAYVYASAVGGASTGAGSGGRMAAGNYHLVLGSGSWRTSNYSFSFYGPSPTPGRDESGNTYWKPYADAVVNSDGVTPVMLPAKTLDTSETGVIFHVVPDADGVQTPIRTLQIYGNSTHKDPLTQANIAASGINLYGTGIPATTLSSKLRGFPGIYNMTAVGTADGGHYYSAKFELDLGTPVNTPLGANVSQTIGTATVTYDNVTSPGTTTVSRLTLGPPSPEGFVIYPSNPGPNSPAPHYFDITTTATYTGTVHVCMTYGDTGMKSVDELRMELANYVCDANNNCTWTTITDPGYPDANNNLLCGTTTGFSYFAILVSTAADSDADGVDDDADNCPGTANADQSDFDGDGVGDTCDSDTDGDGITNDVDLCLTFSSAVNTDLDNDGVGDPCDPDLDNDLVGNGYDNCPRATNADQIDFDEDGQGDACDTDDDNDRVSDAMDVCAGTPASANVDGYGCSSYQRFARVCPEGGTYANHGQYVSCVAREVEAQLAIRLIRAEDAGPIVSSAAHAEFGKKSSISAPKKNVAPDKRAQKK